MKVWELEEGKEYIIGNRCVYKIERGDLLAKFVDYNEWEMSAFTYSEIMNLDFTIYTPPTDWSKVEVDTKVLVSDSGEKWVKRYFARYDVNSKKLYVWDDGTTSWSANGRTLPWTYAKLYTE